MQWFKKLTRCICGYRQKRTEETILELNKRLKTFIAIVKAFDRDNKTLSDEFSRHLLGMEAKYYDAFLTNLSDLGTSLEAISVKFADGRSYMIPFTIDEVQYEELLSNLAEELATQHAKDVKEKILTQLLNNRRTDEY